MPYLQVLHRGNGPELVYLLRGCSQLLAPEKSCRNAAFEAYHKYECTAFLKSGGLGIRARALYRLLIHHQHRLVPDHQWRGLMTLMPHQSGHQQGPEKEAVSRVAKEAKAHTGTALDIDTIERIYCVVSLNFPAIASTPCAHSGSDSYEQHGYTIARAERCHGHSYRRCGSHHEPLLRPKRANIFSRQRAAGSSAAGRGGRRRTRPLLYRRAERCAATTKASASRIFLPLYL